MEMTFEQHLEHARKKRMNDEKKEKPVEAPREELLKRLEVMGNLNRLSLNIKEVN